MLPTHGSGRRMQSPHRGGAERGGTSLYSDAMRSKGTTFIHNEIRLLTGTSNPALADEVAALLGVDLQQPISYYSRTGRGEMDVNISVSLRQKPVFIMQAATPEGVNDGLVETAMMLDASRRGSSGERTVFYAPMPYQRKDRPDDQQRVGATRQAIGARVVLNQLEAAGAQRFQTVELHAPQEVGMTDLPYDALWASRVLVPRLQAELLEPENTVYFSPDYGGVQRARKYNEFLRGKGHGYMYKRRTPDGVEGFGMFGEVEGHHVVLADDILATGSSLIEIARFIHSMGAKSVVAVVTHGEFNNIPGESRTCLQKLEDAGISHIYTTDTLPQRAEIVNSSMVSVVKIAPLIASAFRTVANGDSIHEMVR